MKLFFPKRFRIDVKIPDGLDGDVEGFYEEELDVEAIKDQLGDSWQSEVNKQVELISNAAGIEVIFDTERNVVRYKFDGSKAKDIIDVIVSEFIANSAFAQMTIAELMAQTVLSLARLKVLESAFPKPGITGAESIRAPGVP